MGARPQRQVYCVAGEALAMGASGRRSYGWWGMAWLIATEATLFAALLVSYFYLRFQSGPQWPPGGIEEPHLTLPLAMSAVLLASSLPVHLAEKEIQRDRMASSAVLLAAGFALGAAFLVLTLAVEWPEALKEFSPTTGVYGSLYFTITGFHSAHLLVGLAFSLWVQMRLWRKGFNGRAHLPVTLFGMYWHFVDLVWVFVFAVVYLSPHL